MIARAFRDIWSLVMFFKFSILRPWKASLVPIYHEMDSRSYDFLYLLQTSKNALIVRNWNDKYMVNMNIYFSFRRVQKAAR